MESNQIDHTHTLLLTHLTNHHEMGKIVFLLEGQAKLSIAIHNTHDLHPIQHGLQILQTHTHGLRYAKTGVVQDGASESIKLVLTHLDEIVIALYAFYHQPHLIKAFGDDIKTPFLGLKRKCSKWLKELIGTHQLEIEALSQKNNHPMLFSALLEYGHPLDSKTYQFFLKHMLRETHERIIAVLNANQKNFSISFIRNKNKYKHSLFTNKNGIQYIFDNLECNAHLGLKAILKGYEEFYTNRLTRLIPTRFNRLMKRHLKIESRMDALFNELKDLDSEFHTKMLETETAHHLTCLIEATKRLAHKAIAMYPSTPTP